MPGSMAASYQTVDDDRHAVNLDDDGRPSSLTIAGRTYPERRPNSRHSSAPPTSRKIQEEGAG